MEDIKVPKVTKNNNIDIIANKSKTPPPKVSDNPDPENKAGNDATKPTNETMAEDIAVTIIERILPPTNSPLFIGVIRTLIRVPLSFSPAIASGHMDRTVEYSNDTVNIGKIKLMICFIVLSSFETLGVIGVPCSTLVV